MSTIELNLLRKEITQWVSSLDDSNLLSLPTKWDLKAPMLASNKQNLAKLIPRWLCPELVDNFC